MSARIPTRAELVADARQRALDEARARGASAADIRAIQQASEGDIAGGLQAFLTTGALAACTGTLGVTGVGVILCAGVAGVVGRALSDIISDPGSLFTSSEILHLPQRLAREAAAQAAATRELIAALEQDAASPQPRARPRDLVAEMANADIRRRRIAAAVAGTVAIALGGVGVYMMTRRPR